MFPSDNICIAGIFFIVPCIDTYRKVDLRTVSFDVPPQEILTKDSVTVAVDAVVYFRISNATVSVTNVEDAYQRCSFIGSTIVCFVSAHVYWHKQH